MCEFTDDERELLLEALSSHEMVVADFWLWSPSRKAAEKEHCQELRRKLRRE